jgi:hypothetical protein
MATQNNSIRQLDIKAYPSVQSHSDLNIKLKQPSSKERLPETADTNERI